MNIIKIKRDIETQESTIGEIYLNDNFIGYTLELPWHRNMTNISCIPVGEYSAYIRDKETSRWDYEIIQLNDVFQREAIQIHIGNYPRNTNGCILVGKGKGDNAVWRSRQAFEELMSKLNKDEEIKVIVEYENDNIKIIRR